MTKVSLLVEDRSDHEPVRFNCPVVDRPDYTPNIDHFPLVDGLWSLDLDEDVVEPIWVDDSVHSVPGTFYVRLEAIPLSIVEAVKSIFPRLELVLKRHDDCGVSSCFNR